MLGVRLLNRVAHDQIAVAAAAGGARVEQDPVGRRSEDRVVLDHVVARPGEEHALALRGGDRAVLQHVRAGSDEHAARMRRDRAVPHRNGAARHLNSIRPGLGHGANRHRVRRRNQPAEKQPVAGVYRGGRIGVDDEAAERRIRTIHDVSEGSAVNGQVAERGVRGRRFNLNACVCAVNLKRSQDRDSDA